jgi:hypothetical protein
MSFAGAPCDVVAAGAPDRRALHLDVRGEYSVLAGKDRRWLLLGHRREA